MFFKKKNQDQSSLQHKDDEIRDSLSKLNILDTPIEERFERITRLVCMTLGVPISAFSIIDGERQWFKSIQGMEATQNHISESFCAHTILGDEIMVVEDARLDKRFANNPLVKGDPNITFYAGYPVRAPDGRNIGSLCAIDSKARNITPEQLTALKDLAHMVESELKVAQLSKSQYELIHELDNIHRIAAVDALTRLWNEAGIRDILKREWAAGVRKNSALGIAMVDIDHFKNINEKYGDKAGDLVVRELAKRLLAILRAEDAVARIEADKFMILLPDCEPHDLFETLERIRESVTSKAVTTPAGNFSISLSMGATAKIPNISFEADDMIKTAEAALQKAKANGRDRTEIADFA